MAIATDDGGAVCKDCQAVSGYRKENEIFCYCPSLGTTFTQESWLEGRSCT